MWWKRKPDNEFENFNSKNRFFLFLDNLKKSKSVPAFGFVFSLILLEFSNVANYLLPCFGIFLLLDCEKILYEIGKRKGLLLIRYPFVCGSIITFVLACSYADIMFVALHKYINIALISIVAILMMYSCFFAKIKNKYNAVSDVSYTVFAFLYTTVPICISVLMIGYLITPNLKFDNIVRPTGTTSMLYVLFVTKINDIGRIVGGKIFGGSSSIIDGFDNSHSKNAYFFGTIFSIFFSSAFGFLLEGKKFDYIYFFASLGLIFSIFGTIGSMVVDIFEQDVKIGVSIGRDVNKITDLGVIKNIGPLLINVPIAYSIIQMLDIYIL